MVVTPPIKQPVAVHGRYGALGEVLLIAHRSLLYFGIYVWRNVL